VRIRDNKLDPIGFGLRYRARHAFAQTPFERDAFAARLVFEVNAIQLRNEEALEA